jgi:hypothetical protein
MLRWPLSEFFYQLLLLIGGLCLKWMLKMCSCIEILKKKFLWNFVLNILKVEIPTLFVDPINSFMVWNKVFVHGMWNWVLLLKLLVFLGVRLIFHYMSELMQLTNWWCLSMWMISLSPEIILILLLN